MEIGCNTLCFLDLKISVLDGQLFTTVYSKPTDSHIYLHSTSCHKRSSIIGVQKGVAKENMFYRRRVQIKIKIIQ